jgi:hypothetical protein
MAYLETLEHLAILSKKDPAVVEADPFAQLIMQQATELCISTAGIPDPDWETDPTLVPGRVRTICLYVAFRTYNNPRSVINSGVGPISESILAQAAAAMTLTEAERDELQQLGEENGVGGLWVLSTTAGPETVMDTQFLPDSSPTDWWIPYFANGDVGTEWDETTPPPPAPGGGGTYDGPTMAEFNTLVAQVNTLSTTTAATDASLDEAMGDLSEDISAEAMLKHYGFVASSGDPMYFSNSSSFGPNTLFMTRVWVPAESALNGLWCLVNAAGSHDGASAGNRLGVWEDSGVLIGQTADDPTTWTGGTGWRGGSIVGGPIPAQAEGRFVYVGILAHGISGATIAYRVSGDGAALQSGPTGGNRRTILDGAPATALPAAFNPATYGVATGYTPMVAIS